MIRLKRARHCVVRVGIRSDVCPLAILSGCSYSDDVEHVLVPTRKIRPPMSFVVVAWCRASFDASSCEQSLRKM